MKSWKDTVKLKENRTAPVFNIETLTNLCDKYKIYYEESESSKYRTEKCSVETEQGWVIIYFYGDVLDFISYEINDEEIFFVRADECSYKETFNGFEIEIKFEGKKIATLKIK